MAFLLANVANEAELDTHHRPPLCHCVLRAQVEARVDFGMTDRRERATHALFPTGLSFGSDQE